MFRAPCSPLMEAKEGIARLCRFRIRFVMSNVELVLVFAINSPLVILCVLAASLSGVMQAAQ